MLSGAKVTVISNVPVHPGSPKRIQIEDTYTVHKYRKICWADDHPDREDDLLQFYAVDGGLRTVARKDIVRIR